VQLHYLIVSGGETREKRCTERTHIRHHKQSLVLNSAWTTLSRISKLVPQSESVFEFRMAVMSLSSTQRTKYGSKFCTPASYQGRQCGGTFRLLVRGREESSSEARVVHLRLAREHVFVCLAFASCSEPAGATIERGMGTAAEFLPARFRFLVLSSSYLPVEVGNLADRE